MIETISLLPGITLRACRDTRFKQGCLSFQLVRQMVAEEAALNALLPSVLLRGTKHCPDLRSITEHLDELNVLEEKTDAMKKEYTAAHFARLAEGHCSMAVSPYYASAIAGLERVGDHLVNVGYSIVNPVGSQNDND